MARRLNPDSLYNDVKVAVDTLNVGDTTLINVSADNLANFRAYLTYLGKMDKKKFTTRSTGDKLLIMRIPYHNISRQISELN